MASVDDGKADLVRSRERSLFQLVACALILLTLMEKGFLNSPEIWAAEPVPEASASPEVSEENQQNTPSSRLKLTGSKLREKQRQVQAIALLFMGVVLLGVFLFASVLLYGSWMRRMNRNRPPPMKRGDELWYLKHPPKKETPTPPRSGNPPQEGRSGE